MARNERMIEASPEDVFGVLADARGYAYWVIGSIEVREADSGWPEAGTRFHHTVGVGPLRVQDHTTVEDVSPGRFLQLKTKARPLGNARVKLELERANGGTRVTMIEDPADKPTAVIFTPLTHLATRVRNARSLDRLAELAEGRRPMPGEEDRTGDRSTSGPNSVENPEARRRRTFWMAGLALAGGGSLALLAALSRRRR